jgi:hypothetical protein
MFGNYSRYACCLLALHNTRKVVSQFYLNVMVVSFPWVLVIDCEKERPYRSMCYKLYVPLACSVDIPCILPIGVWVLYLGCSTYQRLFS